MAAESCAAREARPVINVRTGALLRAALLSAAPCGEDKIQRARRNVSAELLVSAALPVLVIPLTMDGPIWKIGIQYEVVLSELCVCVMFNVLQTLHR